MWTDRVPVVQILLRPSTHFKHPKRSTDKRADWVGKDHLRMDVTPWCYKWDWTDGSPGGEVWSTLPWPVAILSNEIVHSKTGPCHSVIDEKFKDLGKI